MNRMAKLLTRLKNASSKKKVQYLIIAIITAIILLIYFSAITAPDDAAASSVNTEEVTSTESDIEERLDEVLSMVQGAGNVKVVIYYESTSELVPAYSEDTSTSTNAEGDSSSSTTNEKADVATVKSGSDTEALIIKEIAPKIKGVLVVAEGAGDIGVRLDLLSAVTTLLDVSADKVEVLKMDV